MPHCLGSLSYTHEYLAIDGGGYTCERIVLFSNCSIAECFPEKLNWFWNEQVCWGEV